MTTNAALAALRTSHDRLVAVLEPLSDAEAAAPAYPSEWSIGQTASHLGSGAEIFTLFVEAGADGSPAPGVEAFQPIWARWDAKEPAQQAHDVVAADQAFLDRVAALSGAETDGWRLDLFGSEQTLPSLLTMRLGEHAVHTWDIAVAIDASAALAPDATELLVDAISGAAARSAQPTTQRRILVTTTEPKRRFLLEFTDGSASLEPADDDAEGDASLTLPAEAFVRLVYGRLDADHTPSGIETEGIDLDELRSTFRGF